MKFILAIFILIFVGVVGLTYDPEFNENTQNANWVPKYPKIRAQRGNETINRPLFHFTPSSGWMNDPNGCFLDPTTNKWNLYFQYCGLQTIWCQPMFWGHAISDDLNVWEEQDLAIGPPDKVSGVFSGSIFIDDENKSGFFDQPSNLNIIAAWTYNYDIKEGEGEEAENIHYQDQWLSYSKDGGMKFITIPPGTKVSGEDKAINPNVQSYLENDKSEKLSAEFRDPQVIKYKGTLSDGTNETLYIMTVAKTQEFRINFYGAKNARSFEKVGSFHMGGYLGHQYECPNLAHLVNSEKRGNDYSDEEGSYWILFISINPGSLLGGSSTQYLIGQFGRKDRLSTNDLTFTLSYPYPIQLDYGKDFYALQLFFELPTDEQMTNGYQSITGIAWTSNWQYGVFVPTDLWRSSMSIPRKFTLGHYKPNAVTPILYLYQEPVLLNSKFDGLSSVAPISFTEKISTKITNIYSETLGAFGSLEFFIDFTLKNGGSNEKSSMLTFYFRGGSNPDEYLKIGYFANAESVFLDRGHTNVQWVKENPSFTEKFTMFTPNSLPENRWTIYGLIDRNIVELFVNMEDSDNKKCFATMTNTFFFSGGNFISVVDVVESIEGAYEGSIRIRQLDFIKNDSTESDSGSRRLDQETDL